MLLFNYIDDIIITGTSTALIETIINSINEKFKHKDLGSLTRTCMDTCSDLFHDKSLYQRTIGVLQHICVTRPDIKFIVNKLNQYMETPYISH